MRNRSSRCCAFGKNFSREEVFLLGDVYASREKSEMKIVAWGDKTGLRPFEDSLSDSEIERVYGWSRNLDILQWSGGSPLDLTLAEFGERLRREGRNPQSDRRMFFIVTHD